MSNNAPAANEPELAPVPEFNQTPWAALFGVRSMGTIADAGKIDFRCVMTPLAFTEQPKEGEELKPDRTDPAVHFADWLVRNANRLMGLWETEYVSYMNLKRATTAPKTARDIGLVDASGLSLDANKLN